MSSWHTIESIEDVNLLIEDTSFNVPCILFKHSTSCSISSIAKLRLDQDGEVIGSKANWYYLDLLRHRPISNYIAEKLNVYHESPQVIIVKNGEATYDVSHLDISIEDLASEV